MIRVFDYIAELDAFVTTRRFAEIADALGLSEWTPVVWIGRLFHRDQDDGEHWHDNWNEREAISARARKAGYDPDRLLIVSPDKMAGYAPCHSADLRKRFWTDVMKSLHVAPDTIFAAAIEGRENEKRASLDPETDDATFERRLEGLRRRYSRQSPPQP